MRSPITIEGVPYRPYRIYYTLANGKRRRMVRWSPGYPWIREEIARELLDRFGLEGLRPRSVSIHALT